jgi:hypothetical protein
MAKGKRSQGRARVATPKFAAPAKKSPGNLSRTRLNAKDRAATKRALTPARKTGRRSLKSGLEVANAAQLLNESPSLADLGKVLDTVRPRLPFEFRVPVRRPRDLLVFDLVFENLELEPLPSSDQIDPEAPVRAVRLKRARTNAPAYMIVEFPPQSFGEEAFLDATGPEVKKNPSPPFSETGNKLSPPAPPKNKIELSAEAHPGIDGKNDLPFARMRMSGVSRLVFRMPDDVTELSYTLADVLEACGTWPMRLDGLAVDDGHRPLVPRRPSTFDWVAKLPNNSDWVATKNELIGAISNFSGPATTQLLQRMTSELIQTAIATSKKLPARTRAAPNAALTTAMTAQLEAFANAMPAFADPKAREAVAATLAISVIDEIAKSRPDLIDLFIDSPSFHVILRPHAPARNVTALELPYRVFTTPIGAARWRHARKLVEHDGRTELWHTRLTNSSGVPGPDDPSKIRAIWTPDYERTNFNPLLAPKPLPYRMSLDPLDRQMLVSLMAGFDKKNDGKPYRPLAADSKRLSLSALGALLDAEGAWDLRPDSVGLSQWKHLATLGRDHYVRVVYAGFLMPFGHAASLIKVTERKFENLAAADPRRVALLRQRFFIVVRQPVKDDYRSTNSPYRTGHQFLGNTLPLRSIEILTRTTPNLLAPEKATITPVNAGTKRIYPSGSDTYTVAPRMVFWPKLDKQNWFQFEVAATDINGARCVFALPMLFVGDEANWPYPDAGPAPPADLMQRIIDAYDAPLYAPQRTAQLHGATICYAPNGASEGVPCLPTDWLRFDAAPIEKGIAKSAKKLRRDVPQFFPEIENANVGIKPIQKLLGDPNARVEVSYADVFKNETTDEGFGAGNPGRLFLKLTTPYPLNFGAGGADAKSDALGGLATPQMAILALSRVTGPVSGKPPTSGKTIEDSLQKASAGTFDPFDFFGGAKILGGIDIGDLLKGAVVALTGATVPKLVSKEFPDRVEASFDWNTEIKQSDPLHLFVPGADGGKTTLDMHGKATTPISASGPGQPIFNAEASLDNFKVNLFGFIIIWFDHLRFTVKPGQKPDVLVDLHRPKGDDDQPVMFGGPLEFVNEIRKLIPSNGFSDPPNLSVTPSGIKAGFSLGLPAIQVGVFSLSNVSLGAGFDLPFDARPIAVRFNFCERQSPFNLIVSFLGGGGFFAIAIDASGVREIEAALEFGAAVQINLGVASGGVEIKAGIYFHWLEAANGKNATVELAGYVRLHGELTVLCIISASLTFNLELGYLKEGGNATVFGEATLIVEIEILVFSASVSVTCRREFAGGQADPKFIDLMPTQSVWNQYCDAFAPDA